MLDHDLKNLLEEILVPLWPVVVKRMFGGGGIFLDGLMFGLIADGTLYLKSDDKNRALFDAEGMKPFSYQKKTGQTTIMSYWQVPERLLDEPDQLVGWARQAFGAAQRAQKSHRPKKSKSRTR
jgi:DNA transformation protein and related proteins